MRTTGRKDSSAVPLGAKSHLASARIFRNCVVCNRNLLFVIAFPAGSKLLSDSLAQTEAVGRKRACGERGGVVQVHSPQQLFAFVDLSLRRFSTSAAMRTTGNAHGWAKPGAPARLTGSAPAAATTMIAAESNGRRDRVPVRREDLGSAEEQASRWLCPPIPRMPSQQSSPRSSV